MNDMSDYTADLDLAVDLALRTGALLQGYFGRVSMDLKADKNAVTQADYAAEKLIVDRLKQARANDGIVAEEGTKIGEDKKRLWLVDPLDATNNFAHGFWVYAVSIALVENGQPVVGVVHAPEMDQTFHAVAGEGAFLNEQPIHVSRVDSLDRAVCATGFPYARRTLPRNNLDEFARITMAVQGIRRVGSAALDLCWVAAGAWDGYWELHLQPWDVAAGMLICAEACGLVTDDHGGEVDLNKPVIVATNGLIHEDLLKLVGTG